MLSHENFITTAQRKQSILRLAKLISYKATRNIPVRGLVKFTSVTTTEHVIDSRGIDLSGVTITWNDPNNSNWKEQFFLVMNRVLTTRYGQPQKSFQVNDVNLDLYSLDADLTSFTNGVFPYTANTGLDSFPMELVPADLDADGPFEREPDLSASFSILYADDGIGDGSDYTGFLGYTKQGTLTKVDLNIKDKLPNRKLTFLPNNVNDTDVWVQQVNSNGDIAARWAQVDTISEQNLIFNTDRTTRAKYEVDTLENDQISVLFGDGDFADMPQGLFRFWMRQSINRSIVIAKNKIVNTAMPVTYQSSTGNSETCTFTFSLCSTLQNGSGSETIEHIRQSAPATYYSQNRMVNGQDYNTFLLKDPSILRLKTINRTFAGQPKYIDWNDASGSYENVKLFGDDLVTRYELGLDSLTTTVSGQALIDSVIEPLLSTNGMITALTHLSATDAATVGVVSTPRTSFIEDNRSGLFSSSNGYVKLIDGTTPDGSLKEKTAMQGLIDRHWYGEPLSYVEGTNNQIWAVIPDPALYPKDDSRIYQSTVPRTIDGVTKYPPGDVGSGLQPIAEQDYFALKFNRTMLGIGSGTLTLSTTDAAIINGTYTTYVGGVLTTVPNADVWTIEIAADGETFYVRSSIQGTLSTGVVGNTYQVQPPGSQTSVSFFTITAGSVPFEPGDAFVIDTINGVLTPRTSAYHVNYNSTGVINLNGWWEILGYSQLPDFAGGTISVGQELLFTQDVTQYSWLIFIKKLSVGYEIHYRNLSLAVESNTTNFWYNEVDQLIDNDTQKRVFDNIKILRSNLDVNNTVLKKNQIYDVVGPIKDSTGVTNFNKLQIMPSDMLQTSTSGDLTPDYMLQFETFSAGSYEYYVIEPSSSTITLLTSSTDIATAAAAFSGVSAGSFTAWGTDGTVFGRRQRMPAISSDDTGLDFMWQHFAPYTNMIDPSPTNIHDAYLITQGYYDGMVSYINGEQSSAPDVPTPLELKTSYSALLKNKMMSDTMVLHSGKFKLLFGSLAEPQYRAKFKVVKTQSSTLTDERIKEELLYVVNTYFDIKNWDFGETFYATDLLSLMHQRLPVDVASVVLVPLYGTNSFGDLFTVESGFDEILLSSAQLSDIEIVDALTSTVIRQVK
jgi:hypothetical protein